ncbi:MAG: ATP-binding protein [Actinomycetota bacterium]
MIAPVGSEPQAALAVFGRTAPDEWGEEELRLLVALAQELRLALQSHRLLLEVTEERERLRRIFEGSREGIALLDESGVVLACNPSLEFLFGADDQELTGALWRDAIDLKAANGVPIHLQDVLTSGEELEAQITKFDKPRWVTLTAAPVEVETGAGWVVLVRDITHQREVEMAKSDFLATISHELRTPLTSIKGSIQVLGRDDLDRAPGSREQMLRIVRRGADRLERLVLNLLYVSQLDASGSAHLFIGQVDLRQVLEEACADLLNGKDADIHFPTEPVFVNGDRERLVHTIEHLLENATTHGQGRVTVDVRIDKDAHILVKDEGPGIPLEEREHIFDRFVRLGDVTTRNVQGAGVGLYIARASVRAMGGDVWVEDPPDRPGSVFHVRLPLITAEARRGDSRLATGDHPARSTQRSIARP